MIYCVEIPHQRPASCWVSRDRADFISRVSATAIQQRSGTVIFEKTSARELLRLQGVADAAEARREGLGWLAGLAEQYGLDTPLFQSNGSDYGPEPVDSFEAHVAYVGSDLSSCELFETDDEALAAYQDEALWRRHGGWAARAALGRCLEREGVLPQAPEDEDDESDADNASEDHKLAAGQARARG